MTAAPIHTGQNVQQFTWTKRETDRAFAVVLALDLIGRFDHAQAVRQSMLALQWNRRAPALPDVWAWFRAKELLTHHRHACRDYDTRLAAFYARSIFGLVSFAVTGRVVIDIHELEAGTSHAFAFAAVADATGAP